MKDSLTIDHGRKDRTRVGRCADCRSEGVVTPTTRGWAGMSMCDFHIESRQAIWDDCQVGVMQELLRWFHSSLKVVSCVRMHNNIRKETL